MRISTITPAHAVYWFTFAALSAFFSAHSQAQTTFTNSASITIVDDATATPYPSTITVSGLPAGQIISKVTVTLHGFTHSFPSDVGVLLVSPSGATTELDGQCGGQTSVSNIDLTFDDAAAMNLPSPLATGTYKPSQCSQLFYSSPAPPPPHGTALSELNGGAANGSWSLYVEDFSSGDSGSIGGGWSLTISTTACSNNFVVTSNADTGAGSLRDALNLVCDGGTITFGAGVSSPIVLASTLSIKKNVTIQGPGATKLTISGNDTVNVVSIGSGNVSVSGLTISNGGTNDNFIPGGTGVTNTSAGVVTITSCVIANNRQSGISNRNGTININGSTIANNSGGAVGQGSAGGGIYNPSGTVNITNSTVAGNSGDSPFGGTAGGGIYNGGSLTIASSTISDNSASSNTDGSAGGGIYGSATIKNTIIAGNSSNTTTGQDLAGSFTSQGFNLIGKSDGSTGFSNGANADQVGTNAAPLLAKLAPLSDNGGPTPTIALLSDSPAIDKGNSFGLTSDQRGGTRPVNLPSKPPAPGGNEADIGAFEAQNTAPHHLAFTVQPGNTNVNSAITPAVEVEIRDASNLLVDSSANVTIALGNNPAGATLSGTTTVAASNGVASFSNLSLNKTANGYTLAASSASLTGATSGPFNVTNPPDLNISKTHSGNFIQGEYGAQYTITVKNIGGAPSNGPVTVVDNLPAGLTATKFEADFGSDWSCTLANLTCTQSDALGVGQTYPPITLTVHVSNNAPSMVTNTATVSGGGDAKTTNNTANDSTIVNACTTQITVTNNADSGPGSLRQAIVDLCDGGSITFAPNLSSPIVLASELPIVKSLTIKGPGAQTLTISGNNVVRIFDIRPDSAFTVNLSGLTLANGKGTSTGYTSGGGAIVEDEGGTGNLPAHVLNIADCVFTNNTAPGPGGAIFAERTLNISNSTFDNNSVSFFGAGAVNFGFGTFTVIGSTFNNNSGDTGAAIQTSDTTDLINCTFANNSVTASDPSGGLGGALYNYFGTVTLTSCTVSGNSASNGGGGLYNYASGGSGVISLANTIVAGNTAGTVSGQDLSGPFTSGGFNLIGKSEGSTGFTAGSNADQVGSNASSINPSLAGLAYNGGPTQTMTLLNGSPAIDKGKSFGLANDQRGYLRSFDNTAIQPAAGGDNTDIGAVEVQPVFLRILAIKPVAGGVRIDGLGTPSTVYHVKATGDLSTAFQPLGTTPPADAFGKFQFTDMTNLTRRFYRLVYP